MAKRIRMIDEQSPNNNEMTEYERRHLDALHSIDWKLWEIMKILKSDQKPTDKSV